MLRGVPDERTATDREVAERLQLEIHDCEERVTRSIADIKRCLKQGLAWRHASVVTHRARLAAALAELDMLELLIGGDS
jgi:hypothetical protein